MLILPAVLAIFVYGLMSPVLGVLLPTYALSAGQQGSLALTNAMGLVIASVSAGPLVDFKGSRAASAIGLTLMAGSLFCLPNTGGYPGLLPAYLALGIGGGVVSTAANSLVSHVAAESRGPALNFLNVFFGLGGILTTFAASYLLTPITLCYSIASLSLAALVINLLTPSPKPAVAQFEWTDAVILMKQPTLLLFSLLMFLYVGCEVGVWNWLKTYLISVHFPPREAGGIVSYGFAFGILVGRALVSWALASIPALNIILVSGAFIVLTTIAMLHASSRIGVTFAVFTAGLAMAPVFPATLSLVADRFPRGTATALGIAITSGWLGLAVSSPIIGTLAANQPLRQALLLLPVGGLAMVLVTLVLRRSLREAPQK